MVLFWIGVVVAVIIMIGVFAFAIAFFKAKDEYNRTGGSEDEFGSGGQ